jgi:hypothetical protein
VCAGAQLSVASTLTLWHCGHRTTFAAGEINAVCVGAQLAVALTLTLWHCGHRTMVCLQQVNQCCVCWRAASSSLVRRTVPRPFMATKIAAPIRPVSYQSICLVSRRYFCLRIFSFHATNSFTIFSSCNIMFSCRTQSNFRNAWPYPLLFIDVLEEHVAIISR